MIFSRRFHRELVSVGQEPALSTRVHVNAFFGDAIAQLELANRRMAASLDRQEQLLGIIAALIQRPEVRCGAAQGARAPEPQEEIRPRAADAVDPRD